MRSFPINNTNSKGEKVCDSTSLIFSCNSFQDCLDKIKRTRLPSNHLPLFHLKKSAEKKEQALAAEFESASNRSQHKHKFKENRAHFGKCMCETELFFDVAFELIEKILLSPLCHSSSVKNCVNQILKELQTKIWEDSSRQFKYTKAKFNRLLDSQT